ncbi:MAG: YkgJ family cysteine cluster protein [Quinella sp. 2Q5]|nr:YkgJ family cysteine cluster protein [Quinella sp. 2Q5]
MFDCSRCGACCRNIRRADFPHDLDRGDGVCKNFDEATNLCTVYATRPIFCNVDAWYEKFLANTMSREDFYALNHEACRRLNLTAAANRAIVDA